MSPSLEIFEVPTRELVPYASNAKLHTAEQIDQIAESIERYGNNDPIAVWHNADGEMEIVEGHGRLMALNKLGIESTPVIVLDHLTDEQRRAYSLVHNQLTINSGFDYEMLMAELESIADEGLEFAGFDIETEIANAMGEIEADLGGEFDGDEYGMDERQEHDGGSMGENGEGFVVCPRCGHVQKG